MFEQAIMPFAGKTTFTLDQRSEAIQPALISSTLTQQVVQLLGVSQGQPYTGSKLRLL